MNTFVNWNINFETLSNNLIISDVTSSSLTRNIDGLLKINELNLPEVVAFYAGRILELMVSNSVNDLGLNPGSNLIINLGLLKDSGSFDDGYILCGHYLRLFGNYARHLIRDLKKSDESIIIALLQIWLEGCSIFRSQNEISFSYT